jgi:hypothetical protein
LRPFDCPTSTGCLAQILSEYGLAKKWDTC